MSTYATVLVQYLALTLQDAGRKRPALPCPAKHQSMKRRQHLPFAEFKAKNRSRQIMSEKYGIDIYGDMIENNRSNASSSGLFKPTLKRLSFAPLECPDPSLGNFW